MFWIFVLGWDSYSILRITRTFCRPIGSPSTFLVYFWDMLWRRYQEIISLVMWVDIWLFCERTTWCIDDFSLQTVLKIGWFLTIIMAIGAFFGPAPMGSVDYVYNPIHAASYNAFAPIGWCAIFIWMTFLAHTGNTNGKANDMIDIKGRFGISWREVYGFQWIDTFYRISEQSLLLERFSH